MAGKPGMRRGVAAVALRHVLDNPGVPLRKEQLAKAFGCTELQAQNAITYLMRNGKAPGLKAVQNGHVWVYEPEGNDEPKWVLVRLAAQGSQAVLEDPEGNLWVAKPVGV